MKKILIVLIAAVSLLSSCKSDMFLRDSALCQAKRYCHGHGAEQFCKSVPKYYERPLGFEK